MAEEPIPTEEIEDVGPEPKAKASVPWIPLVLVLLFIPIITLVLVQFVVIPQLKNSLSYPDEASESADAAGHAAPEAAEEKGGGHGGGHGGGGDETATTPDNVVVYEDVIANLAGTMGTRFLKVSFQIVGESGNLKSMATTREAQVRDAIISTLSSRTIQQIEIVGGRNSLRIALMSAINDALGSSMVNELYFLDFIIQ